MTDREKWLSERVKGIGSSDAPAVLGLSKWKTPMDVYLSKRGELVGEQEDNEAMYWGRALEPVIRQRYADETGRTVIIPELMVSEQHPFMIASLDGVTTDGRVVEVKTARSDLDWGAPGTDEVPEIYMVQVQHQMIVSKISVADIPVLFKGHDFRIYTVDADPELQDIIIERETEFWNRVQTGNPPDPVNLADVIARFGRTSTATPVQASIGIASSVTMLKKLKEALKALETDEETLKAQILGFLGEHDTLLDGEKIIATWKLSKGRETLDAKKLKAELPEIYKQYLTAGEPSRRFLLK